MLQVNNLTKKYGKVVAANDVSFIVPDGSIGVLLGPNGAGKSTVIKSIAGLLKCNGSILVNDIPHRNTEAKKIFAYVPEMPALFPALSVADHMEYIAHAYNLTDYEDYMNEILTRFELDDKKDKLGDELSKGMMQKVSICCALLIKPKVILLDEPMVGLDPKAIKEIRVVLEELKANGTTVLISTHMLEMVKDIWDFMIVMDKGHIVKTINKADASDKDIEELFFEATEGSDNE